jgi:ATP-dependent Clp protease ATP-binding subunit ClpA
MMERFTEQAFKVMMLAQQESRQLGHNFYGTEQLLLGTIGVEDSIAARALKSMGVTLDRARVEVEKIIGRGSWRLVPTEISEIPFSPNARRALELAEEECQQLGHDYIGAEHLLLGTLRVEEGNALKVLANLGVDSTQIRDLVVRMVGENSEVTENPYDLLRDYLDAVRKLRSIRGVENREIVKRVCSGSLDKLLKEWENSDRFRAGEKLGTDV